jgi:hypothetical protein
MSPPGTGGEVRCFQDLRGAKVLLLKVTNIARVAKEVVLLAHDVRASALRPRPARHLSVNRGGRNRLPPRGVAKNPEGSSPLRPFA